MAGKRRASVSLVMIVRNEEGNLGDCLGPIAELFDEIIVVDTGSQDATREIASRFTPDVFDFPWCDDFSAARNEGLRRASGEWVFWLDADDRVDAANAARLRELLDGLDERPRVFMMNVVSQPRDAAEVAWVVSHPRLFLRHPEMQWRGRVHEQLRPEPAALGYEVVTSDVEIEHVGYQDAVLAVRKHQRKLRLLRMDYAVNPEDPSTLFHLGMACAKLGTAAEARKYLLRLAALSAARGDYLRRVYGMLAELSLGEGKFADALRMADRGLAMFPDDEQLRYVAAQVLYEIGKYDMAAGLLAAVMNGSQPPSPYECGPNHIRRKLAPRALAAVQRMQGDFAGAEATLLKVAGEFPADTQSWYNLGLVYLDTNRREGLALALDRLSACPNGVFFANLLRAVRCLRSDQLEAAGAMIDQLVSESPHTPLPRMLRVEWLSRSRAPLGSQIQALCDLLRIQPGNAEARGWLNKLEAASLPALPAVGDGCTSVVLMPGVVAAG